MWEVACSLMYFFFSVDGLLGNDMTSFANWSASPNCFSFSFFYLQKGLAAYIKTFRTADYNGLYSLYLLPGNSYCISWIPYNNIVSGVHWCYLIIYWQIHNLLKKQYNFTLVSQYLVCIYIFTFHRLQYTHMNAAFQGPCWVHINQILPYYNACKNCTTTVSLKQFEKQ